MSDVFSAIGQAAATMFGAGVFAVLMLSLAKMHSRMWRSVSADYPKRSRSPAGEKKFLDTIVITRRGASIQFRQYAGSLITVHDRSLSISLLPPFNILCPPIELPFDEMELRRTDWALWPEPYALQMRRREDLEIVLGRDTVERIRRQTDIPPFGLGA